MKFESVFSFELFSMGGNSFTVQRVLILGLIISIFIFTARRIKRLWLKRISNFEPERRGAVETLSRFGYYVILFLGIMIVLHSNGVDLTALTVLTSALGVGIGFGMQSITSNLISGIIILFERPIKVGDRIQVEDVSGNVTSISIRAVTVLTNDNISVIVPNSNFITQKVVNWSLNDRKIRLNIKIGVSYSADPKVVIEALLAAAASHSAVLKKPEPDVLLEDFGENAILFCLRVWTEEFINRPGVLKSEINFKILEGFKSKGIQIPFPQRDIFIKEFPENRNLNREK